jgi:membrane-bound ClpP family serine protease
MANQFPRGTDMPSQSPLFWVNHKDRYLRQLLICDIEAETKRDLIVYFTDCDRTGGQIDQTDDSYLTELLSARSSDNVDLLLETNGGFTDATEKICSVLRNAKIDLRVIVPRRAKSNGTVVAFCGRSIVMGPDSELGPIDPFWAGLPADYIVKSAGIIMQKDPILVQTAISVIQQTKTLATYLLSTGMLFGKDPADIGKLVEKLATRDQYHSHGAVIDADEASSLGLAVELLAPNSELLKKLWLLRTMYAFDCPQRGYAKVFESRKISSPVAVPPPLPK